MTWRKVTMSTSNAPSRPTLLPTKWPGYTMWANHHFSRINIMYRNSIYICRGKKYYKNLRCKYLYPTRVWSCSRYAWQKNVRYKRLNFLYLTIFECIIPTYNTMAGDADPGWGLHVPREQRGGGRRVCPGHTDHHVWVEECTVLYCTDHHVWVE